MSKLEYGKSGVLIYRKFNGIKYHWTGDIYKSKKEAQKVAQKSNESTRVIKLPQGYVIYMKYRSIF